MPVVALNDIRNDFLCFEEAERSDSKQVEPAVVIFIAIDLFALGEVTRVIDEVDREFVFECAAPYLAVHRLVFREPDGEFWFDQF